MDRLYKTEIYEVMDGISIEDLDYVEQDLAYYEKVSMVFLLFGDHEDILYSLQKLLTLYNNQKEETNFLYSFAKTRTDWKVPIVEALAIIKAYMVIRKLGFDKTEVIAHFLPHIAEISVRIHPILKTLYIICERLTPSEAGKLRLAINPESTLRFYDDELLEIFLLDWITKAIIRIGQIDRNDVVKQSPDLDKLIEYFKFNNDLILNDLLQSSIKKFHEKIPPRRHENDSVFEGNNGPSGSVIQSFDRRESIAICEPDASYNVRRDMAGFILIINQMNFSEDDDEELKKLLPPHKLIFREGSDKDVSSLSETFATFGYKPWKAKNLKHYEIIDTIKDVVKRSEAYDSLIVCILSHGADGVVYGSNSIPVEIEKIKEILTGDELLAKPKLLIIQACQGRDLQEAKKIVNYEECDGPSSGSGTTAAALADMLVWNSTVSGYASFRHKIEGTWFIQSLCRQVEKFGDSKHWMDIVTLVSNDVQSKRGYENQCMVPVSLSTLKKYLYLPKRY